MLRSASRGARSLTEHLGKRVTNLRLNNRGCASGTVSRTFASQQNDDVFSALSATGSFAREPQPLVAVAYAYDYDDDFEDDMSMGQTGNTSSDQHFSGQHAFKHDVTSRRIGMPLSASGGPSGQGPSSSTPYPPPSSMSSSKAGASRKVGGGGGGRHRCPKCGTTVTFRCDYEDNTFYCASCSGWFVVNPNTIHANVDGKPDGSPYEEFMAKNGPRKASDPEILMRHVSGVKLRQWKRTV
jgi:predicted RNA-binding Zn-ribbon protein involved in translation (DUF1610 family)